MLLFRPAAIAAILVSTIVLSTPLAHARKHHRSQIDLPEGQVALEVVGQVNNLPPSGNAPLGSSNQFGYVSFLHGVDPIFTDSTPANQNESTAELTFFTQVNTERVTSNGPFKIIVRAGTTTLYLNTPPSSFNSPASFQQGTPILTANIRQQVIVDTVENTFTVENQNTITSSSTFSINNTHTQLGDVGDGFLTALQGVLSVRTSNPPPAGSPTGFFSGYAVGFTATED